jgi:hypothetical protein
MVCTLGSLQHDKVFTPDAGELVARLLCSDMLAVNVAFPNTQPTPDGRQAGSWELRPTTPRQQPAICGIFDQSYLAGVILATRLPMTWCSCSPEEPSSVLDRSKALGPAIFISHRSLACEPMIETR